MWCLMIVKATNVKLLFFYHKEDVREKKVTKFGFDIEFSEKLCVFDCREKSSEEVYLYEHVVNDQVVSLFARRPTIVYMHDNARPHTANATTVHT